MNVSPTLALRKRSSSGRQNVAIGLTAEPVPPRTASGATVSMNSQRSSSARRLAQRGQVDVVEQVHPQADDQEVVQRVLDARTADHRLDVLRRLAAEQRHVALPQPRQARDVESGRLLGDRPGAHPRAADPASRAHEHRVAGRHPEPGLPLPGLEVLGVDGRARLEVVHALEPRDVHQHAARDDAVLEVVDGAARMAVRQHLLLVRHVAVVGRPVVEDVGERVDVRHAVAVVADVPPVAAEAVDLLDERAAVVDRRLGIEVERQRHGHAVAHQRGGLAALGRRDQVQRADLVVRAPAPPVRQLGLPAVVLGAGHLAAGLRAAGVERETRQKHRRQTSDSGSHVIPLIPARAG